MICRLWRGWTTPEDAAAYERVVRMEVIPAIEARKIPGFRHVDLMKRDLGGEIEFQTLMWFDSVDAIRNFMGEDYTVSHVPMEWAMTVISPTAGLLAVRRSNSSSASRE